MNEMPKLTIEYASGSSKQLLQWLSEQKTLELNLENVSTIDLAGIQILVALVRQASRDNCEVHFVGRLSDSFQEQIALGGLTTGPCPTGETFEAVLKAVC